MSSPNNLPSQLTRFIGREREIAAVTRLLTPNGPEGSRLVTLTGSGGSGKTRLAVQVAAGLLPTYPDGVWFVELATLSDGALVPQAVISVLGLREKSGRPLVETLADYLRPQRPLLVLDTCEHLRAACGDLVTTLLHACPELRVLATSREALGLPGEITWRVPSLAVPDPRRPLPPAALAEYEAVQLFLDRARLRRPDFQLTPDNAAAVAQLCARLDGIPLALELAAARVPVLAVEQIVARLDERFRLLVAGGQTALPRQQTLQALMDWSYDLLSEAERVLFRSLAVFAGGCTLEAVEDVCGGEFDRYALLDLLSRLVDKSLVIMEDQGGAARYRMLETIQQYAWEKLRAARELPALRRRHRAWGLALAEQAAVELLSEKHHLWLARLETELDNLRAALALGGTDPEDLNATLRLAGALAWFWYFRGYVQEGRGWLESALAQARAAGLDQGADLTWATAISAAGALAFVQSDNGAARARLEEGVACWRTLGVTRGRAYTQSFLGLVLNRLGDPAARAMGEESVALFRAIGDRWGLALALDHLGGTLLQFGDASGGTAYQAQSLALFQELGDRWGMAMELGNFGRAAFRQGDYGAARARLGEALALHRAMGDNWQVAWTLHDLADVARAEGDAPEATALAEESLSLFRTLGDRGGIARVFFLLGELARSQGQTSRAVTLLTESETIFHALGEPALLPAIAQALADVGGPASAPSAPPNRLPAAAPDSLTPREIEVLRLVAEGLTDAQVADRLVLSTRTVQSHLRSIYSKLGITTRSAVTRYAIEHRLA